MTRVIAWLSLAAVALVAAIASYLHALVVVQAADGRTAVAWFIPLLAALVVASGAANVLDASRTGHSRPGWSMVAIGVGLAATLYANVAAGFPHLVPAWLVNVWPPVAFGLALESITGMVRRGRGEIKEDVGSFLNLPASQDEPDEPPDLHADMAWLLSRHSQRQGNALTGASRPRLAKLTRPAAVAEAVPLNGNAPDGRAPRPAAARPPPTRPSS